jgi:hypothetical protein
MESPHDNLHHPTKSQKAAFYLLVSFILGTGIYFLAQGIAQFLY